MGKRVINPKDFVRDLGRGARGEDIAQAFLEGEFGIVVDNVSDRNPDYDLIVSGIDPEVLKKPKVKEDKLLKKFYKTFGKTIEVKFDEAAARYKNFFIEVFFDIEKDVPGTLFKCKADLLVWVIPAGRSKYTIYMFKRPDFLVWLVQYLITSKKKPQFKTPGISPRARGYPIPIKDAAKGFACLGEFDFKCKIIREGK